MKSQINICFAIGILFLLTTCGDNNPTSTNDDDPVDPNVESKEIGPAGGNLTSKDGLLTLTIPAGALGEAQTITVKKITANDLGSEFENINVQEAYELGPDGLEFDVPVIVSFAEDQDPIVDTDSLEINSVALLSSENGEVIFLDSLQTIVDSDEDTIMGIGQLSHFSPIVKTRGALTLRIVGLRKQIEVSTNFFDVFVGGEVDLNKFNRDSVLLTAGPESPLEVEEGSGLQKLALLNGAYIQNVRHRCPEVGTGRFIIGVAIESEAKQSGEFILVKRVTFCEPATKNLQVALEGDGSGSVSSKPAGIDCPDDCTEDYSENTVVELEATPDEGSIFKNWSENGTILSTASSIDITMDQARSVTATFGVPASVNGVLIALRALPINAVITYIETAIYVRFLNGYLPALNQQSNGMGLVNASQAERLPLLLQGAEGFIIFDLISDEVLLDFTGLPNNGSVGNRTPLGALAVSRPNPGPGTPAVLASYAQDSNNFEFGFNLFPYDSEAQEFIKGPLDPYPSTVDAFPIGGEIISDEVVIVREGGFGINFLRFSETVGEYIFRPRADILHSSRYGFEQPVTAYGEEAEGALLVVNEVGDLYFEPRTGLVPTVNIGNLGQRIIRLRCELPICVATDIDGNALRIITWDGQTEPTIIGNPVAVGAGPVDPDLYTLPNGNILIAVTGFNDNTISILEVGGNGSVLSNKLYETPQGCEKPGHVIIEENSDDAANPMIIGTCYESANYFVNDLFNTTNLFTQIGGM
jgi:hypothetical protein